jgi:hypothetical protein
VRLTSPTAFEKAASEARACTSEREVIQRPLTSSGSDSSTKLPSSSQVPKVRSASVTTTECPPAVWEAAKASAVAAASVMPTSVPFRRIAPAWAAESRPACSWSPTSIP